MLEPSDFKIPRKFQPYLKIGTCSWKFDSWAGLFYQPGVKYTADSYLPDYAKYLNSVEVDQWFWSLYPAGPKLPDIPTVKLYTESVPDNFRFTVKAPNSISLTHFYSRQPKAYENYADQPNKFFMNVQLLKEFLDKIGHLGDKLGPIMFQFEYLNKKKMESSEKFLEILHEFFSKAPKGYQYAIETRNKNYLKPEFFNFLKEHKLGFVFLDGYYMPPVSWVHESFDTNTADFSILRLHGPDREGMEAATGKEWSKIIEPKDNGLKTAAKIVSENKLRKVTTYVNVNNHYEGSAPITIQRFLDFLGEEKG